MNLGNTRKLTAHKRFPSVHTLPPLFDRVPAGHCHLSQSTVCQLPAAERTSPRHGRPQPVRRSAGRSVSPPPHCTASHIIIDRASAAITASAINHTRAIKSGRRQTFPVPPKGVLHENTPASRNSGIEPFQGASVCFRRFSTPNRQPKLRYGACSRVACIDNNQLASELGDTVVSAETLHAWRRLPAGPSSTGWYHGSPPVPVTRGGITAPRRSQ